MKRCWWRAAIFQDPEGRGGEDMSSRLVEVSSHECFCKSHCQMYILGIICGDEQCFVAIEGGFVGSTRVNDCWQLAIHQHRLLLAED